MSVNLTMKYTEKDFWGVNRFCEDTITATAERIDKAFKRLSKDYWAAIAIGRLVIGYDSMTEFEEKIVEVRAYDETNPYSYTVEKIPFKLAKKLAVEQLVYQLDC